MGPSAAAQSTPADSPKQLTIGQRAVLEALRGFDDQHLHSAPHIHDLLRAHQPDHDKPTDDQTGNQAHAPLPDLAGRDAHWCTAL